jgi:hypothetical protein
MICYNLQTALSVLIFFLFFLMSSIEVYVASCVIDCNEKYAGSLGVSDSGFKIRLLNQFK